MNKQLIGICGVCGGTVTIPTVWYGVVPPIPTCESCGATAKPTAPVLDMNPVPRQQPIDTRRNPTP